MDVRKNCAIEKFSMITLLIDRFPSILHLHQSLPSKSPRRPKVGIELHQITCLLSFSLSYHVVPVAATKLLVHHPHTGRASSKSRPLLPDSRAFFFFFFPDNGSKDMKLNCMRVRLVGQRVSLHPLSVQVHDLNLTCALHPAAFISSNWPPAAEEKKKAPV